MAGLVNASGMSSVRKKQIILLFGLGGVVTIIAFAAAFLGSPKKAEGPVRVTDQTRKAFGVQGEKVNPSEIWRTQEGARVSQIQTELMELKTKMALREKSDANAKREAEEAAMRKAEEDKDRHIREKAEQDRLAALKAPPPNALPVNTGDLGRPDNLGAPPRPQQETIKGIMRVDMGSSTSSATPGKPGAGNVSSGQHAPGGDKNSGPDVKGQSAETYIPAGSFMRGVLLAGLDAPTGGQSQQNPHPILIEVLDMASLPNKFKADYKNCRIVGNGVGDLSAERAYIRLDRMSCITEDGGAIDVAVKGFVADQSGKNGIRGRLVSKQGSVLANALLAGVASGIGNAFTQGAMTTSVSPLGSTQTVDSGKELQAGIGTGVGKALDQLSRYYIQLAEKMFPIIEVDAGQPVDIVLTKGLSVARK